MKWRSPWSTGYPGWHLECSAMSMKYLGETIDIHGGGMENKFPHHDCEIAQAESVTGKPYVRYWMHNNMVTVNGTKMGKSLKNSVNLKDIFRDIDPLVVRFFILQSHYRSPLDYSETAVKASATGLEKLRETLRRLKERRTGSGAFDVEPFRLRFIEAMDDDFNTPVAIAALFELSKALNAAMDSSEGVSEAGRQEALAFLDMAAGGVLGILRQDGGAGEGNGEELLKRLECVMGVLLGLRAEARQNKEFALSDKIRDRLLEAGIEIKDTKEGASWSIKN